jgi:tetratricopeptide (TPR) repeat protein
MDNTKPTTVNNFVSNDNMKHNTSPAKDATSNTTSPLVFETRSNDHPPRRRIIQNFFLIWVDSCIDESINDYQDIITQLQYTVNTIYTYTNINSCVEFLTKNGDENAFLIVSSSFSQQLVPIIHDMLQLHAIYIFDNETMTLKEWTNEWSKVKGVYSKITSICEALKEDVKQCNRNYIPISFVPSNNGTTNLNLDQLDPSFMYSQIFKEILLSTEYNEKSIEDLVAYCRQQYERNRFTLSTIAEFEHEYRNRSPIWWYTRHSFIYEMLNRALRNLEAETIIKMGFFIDDLHRHIKQLHLQQYVSHRGEPFTVYRGQGLLESDFEKFTKTKGGLMSFNNFLSTSINRTVSLLFAPTNSPERNTIAVLFEIKIDPSISSSPFARIDDISQFRDEEEVLFSMHTVFRIGEIKPTEDNTHLWQVNLELTSDQDQQLSTLTKQIRQETSGSTGYERLGKLLIKIGQFQKAEELYQVLLDQTSNMYQKSIFYQQIGDIKDNRGAYDDAILFYEKALEIKENFLPEDSSELGTTYIHIGAVYMKMENFSKASWLYAKGTEILQKIIPSNLPDLTTSYIDTGRTNHQVSEHFEALLLQEKALESSQKTLRSNSPHLAASYNNIGVVYHNVGEYSKALSFYDKALEIFQKTLPSNHPSLATSYNNIGAVYKNMGEYSKGLSYYEKSLEIRHKSLPPNHPDLAISYTNIGMLYQNMGEYSKALSYHEKSLEIQHKTLPSNHPNLATSYNNIGAVYKNMGEYSKALSYHEKALKIQQKTLPSNHPDLTTSYNNIGAIYKSLGEYSEALSYYEKALEIQQKTLPPNHPDLATYNNIGAVYKSLGEYSKALSYYEKSLEIQQKTLPSNHPDMAISYTDLGMLYQNMGEYSKALSCHEKSLEIQQMTLPPNHPDLAISYTNFGMLYENIGELSKALSYFQRAIDIFQRTLPFNHPNLQAVQKNIELVKNKLRVTVDE